MRGKLLVLGLAATAWAIRRQGRIARARWLEGKVVAITGGSRGLGLALAEEFARQGCSIAICARGAGDLEQARLRLESLGADVLAQPCDVARRDEVSAFLERTTGRFGRIDVLVNNAGVISAGPLEAQTHADYERAMAIMFWGTYWPTMGVLDAMRERGDGRIVNITSLGGKVAIPHLLPYTSAKFAAVGFSEGLRADLAGSGVLVTTVVPGLLRTGSYLNAEFLGRPRQEFVWFSLLGNLPLTSTDGRSAARRIVRAARDGEAELTIGLPTIALVRLHGLAPGLTGSVLGLVGRFLPSDPGDEERGRARGWQSETPVSRSFLTRLGRKAAHALSQYPLKGSRRAA